MNDQVLFSITIDDVESVLGRKMTAEEIELFKSKFTIHDWPGEVSSFLDCFYISINK